MKTPLFVKKRGGATVYKSYKIRLYPTKTEENLMWKHIHCCRFVWNYMLDLQNTRYENKEKYLQKYEMCGLLTSLKQEEKYEWLNEVSNNSLKTVCIDLHYAFQRFFQKDNDYPKFKTRKHHKFSFPVRDERTWFDGKNAHIEKIGKIKYKAGKDLPIGRNVAKLINPRIVNKNGKWLLKFVVECENQTPTLTDKPMGIDLGVKETMTVAYGDECIVFHNINKSKTMRNLNTKIKHQQRVISRKYMTNKQGDKYVKTNNILKAEDKLRKLYARVANIRSNYIHQSTHKLVSLLPCSVVMENLNVAGMLKNRHLTRAVQEQCFYEIARQMEYKCAWNNIPFYKADRFFPSSKTCSCCGCIKTNLTLKDRIFKCEDCGFVIDRDLNAAINLQKYIG